MAKTSERKELLWRILVLIVSGIILEVWAYLTFVLTAVNWIIILFSGKRNKELANFCGYWVTEFHRFFRYITCATNERPFPFTSMGKSEKFER